jgi:hypothetical protein
MRALTWIMLLILTGRALGHGGDFQVITFEASDYRSFEQTELEELLGPNATLIPHFACNGRDEFDPYYPAVRTNPAGNSLFIKPSQGGDKIIYRQGQYSHDWMTLSLSMSNGRWRP